MPTTLPALPCSGPAHRTLDALLPRDGQELRKQADSDRVCSPHRSLAVLVSPRRGRWHGALRRLLPGLEDQERVGDQRGGQLGEGARGEDGGLAHRRRLAAWPSPCFGPGSRAGHEPLKHCKLDDGVAHHHQAGPRAPPKGCDAALRVHLAGHRQRPGSGASIRVPAIAAAVGLEAGDEDPQGVGGQHIQCAGHRRHRQGGDTAQAGALRRRAQQGVAEEGVEGIVQQVADSQARARGAHARVQAVRAFRVGKVEERRDHGARERRRVAGRGGERCHGRRCSLLCGEGRVRTGPVRMEQEHVRTASPSGACFSVACEGGERRGKPE